MEASDVKLVTAILAVVLVFGAIMPVQAGTYAYGSRQVSCSKLNDIRNISSDLGSNFRHIMVGLFITGYVLGYFSGLGLDSDKEPQQIEDEIVAACAATPDATLYEVIVRVAAAH